MSAGVVVVVRGAALPAAALKILRESPAVYAATDVDPALFGVPPVTEAPSLVDVVLLAGSRDEPAASLLIATGAEVIETPVPPLVEAADVMDRLRSPGGCPWDAVQTHDSLRQYLVEETYELLDAIEEGDREALREELGDVLLQVLFHARVAAEDAQDPFGIDDVADTLIRKLGNRVPAVLAGQEISLEDQIAQWEERKALEKAARTSCMDEVPTALPALALAQKLIERTGSAGLPADLLPAGLTSVTLEPGVDAESALRTVALEFIDNVREAERRIVAARRGDEVAVELDAAPLGAVSEDEWREHWPVQDV